MSATPRVYPGQEIDSFAIKAAQKGPLAANPSQPYKLELIDVHENHPHVLLCTTIIDQNVANVYIEKYRINIFPVFFPVETRVMATF